jgi:predicted permease
MYQEIILLFALMLTGYICKRVKIISDGMTEGMSGFIISIAYPCLILNRTSLLSMDQGAFPNFILTCILSLVLFLAFGAYAYFYVKLRRFPQEDAPIAEFAILAPNNGFIGFPIAITFFGDIGLLNMVACNLALNIIFFSYGIILLQRGRAKEPMKIGRKLLEFLKLICNPKILSTIIGLFLCYNEIRLPGLLAAYFSTIGAVATPLAMIFIGAMLSKSNALKVIKNRCVLEASLNKILIVPLLTFGLVFFLPIPAIVKVMLIIGNALPVATTVPLLSAQYKRNETFAGEILFVSTVCAIATMPCIIWIVKTIFTV